jgi:K+-transporting ATPase KdpF subunit
MVTLSSVEPTPPKGGGHDATCGGTARVQSLDNWMVGAKAEGEDRMGIAFLSLVILCVFVYLFYALFRAENF